MYIKYPYTSEIIFLIYCHFYKKEKNLTSTGFSSNMVNISDNDIAV